MSEKPGEHNRGGIGRIRRVLAVLAACMAMLCRGGTAVGRENPSAEPGLVEDIRQFHTIRAGYGVLPPYTQEDPITHQVSGLSVDIVNAIAAQVGATVEWKRFHWNTMKADMDGGGFDLIAEPFYFTVRHGLDFTVSESYAYFVLATGVVRSDGRRFADFDHLNDPAVRVAVEQGSQNENVVKARAPRATLVLKASTLGSDEPMNAVSTGGADIAIMDPKQAARFVAAHPANLAVLWGDNPQIYVPAGFAVRWGDNAGADFLNVAVRSLRAMGVLQAIAERYQMANAFRDPPNR